MAEAAFPPWSSSSADRVAAEVAVPIHRTEEALEERAVESAGRKTADPAFLEKFGPIVR